MKALIVLENHFFVDLEGKVWCDRIISYNFLKRYLNVFDEIIVAARTSNTTQTKDKLLVSGHNVSFLFLPEFIGMFGFIKKVKVIKKKIKNEISNVDVVIFRAPSHISLFTYKIAKKSGKPLGLEFVMSAEKMIEGSGFIVKIMNNIIDFLAKKMCLSANGVSYVTEVTLQKKYPCRAIKDGESYKYFTSSYSTIDMFDKDYYKQNWNHNSIPNCFEIIHTGYMDSYRKGQDTLLRAVKIVKDNGLNVHVTFVGDGRKKNEFIKLSRELKIDDIVDFVGLVKDKDELFNYLRKSHILVFPTHSEGLPRTIIEAMSQGLPCLASPVDGVPELLDDEYLIDYKDIEGYAAKMVELFSDWNAMIQAGSDNYNRAKKYCKSTLEKKRVNFYNKLKDLCNENNET